MSTTHKIRIDDLTTSFDKVKVPTFHEKHVATFHENHIDFFGSKFDHQDFEIMRGLLDWFHSLEGDHPVKTEIMTEIALRRLQK
jgi:hypothetical protein